jgi:hypothetical protein
MSQAPFDSFSEVPFTVVCRYGLLDDEYRFGCFLPHMFIYAGWPLTRITAVQATFSNLEIDILSYISGFVAYQCILPVNRPIYNKLPRQDSLEKFKHAPKLCRILVPQCKTAKHF